MEQVDVQRKDFMRLGVMGDWVEPVPDDGAALRGRAAARVRADHPQRPPVQGLQARALVPRLPLGAGRGRGRVRGAHVAGDRRALRGRSIAPTSRGASALPALPPGRASVVIWTTTPWTLPANQAVALHPEFDYSLLRESTRGDAARGVVLLRRERARAGRAAALRRIATSRELGARRRARRSKACSCGIRSTTASCR